MTVDSSSHKLGRLGQVEYLSVVDGCGGTCQTHAFNEIQSPLFGHTSYFPNLVGALSAQHQSFPFPLLQRSPDWCHPQNFLLLFQMTTPHVIASSSGHQSQSTSSNGIVGNHFRVGKKIGEGSFGVVFEGRPVPTDPPNFVLQRDWMVCRGPQVFRALECYNALVATCCQTLVLAMR